MKTTVDLGVVVLTLAMMLSVGLELQGRHFQQLARRKALLLFALAGQMVILPAVGLLITRLLSLPTHVALGILLLAACPVGDIANFYTLLARGNVALSVAVNALSCLLSFATMAVVFEIYGRLSGGIFSFSVPSFALVVRLLLLVAAPILAGMGLRLMRPNLAERVASGLRIGCVIGVLALCGFVVATQREQLAADWKASALASTTLIVAAMACGYLLSRTLALKPSDAFTFSIIFPIRNVALAVTVAVTLMNEIEYAAVAVVYFLSEALLLLVSVAAFRFWQGTLFAVEPATERGLR